MTPAQFQVQVPKLASIATAKQMSAIVRRTAIELHGKIGENMPVRSGYARNGTHLSVGTPSNWVPPPGKKSYPAPRAESLAAWKPGQTIYAQNGVHYMRFIEWGTPRMAAQAPFARAVAAMSGPR